MLRATIEAGIQMRVIRPAELKRVNVDTTVETRAIRFPTDARLYQRMCERLVKVARAEGLTIKQSYKHVGRRLLMQSSRYAHAPPNETCSRLHAQTENPVGPRYSRGQAPDRIAIRETRQVTLDSASNLRATKA